MTSRLREVGLVGASFIAGGLLVHWLNAAPSSASRGVSTVSTPPRSNAAPRPDRARQEPGSESAPIPAPIRLSRAEMEANRAEWERVMAEEQGSLRVLQDAIYYSEALDGLFGTRQQRCDGAAGLALGVREYLDNPSSPLWNDPGLLEFTCLQFRRHPWLIECAASQGEVPPACPPSGWAWLDPGERASPESAGGSSPR